MSVEIVRLEPCFLAQEQQALAGRAEVGL